MEHSNSGPARIRAHLGSGVPSLRMPQLFQLPALHAQPHQDWPWTALPRAVLHGELQALLLVYFGLSKQARPALSGTSQGPRGRKEGQICRTWAVFRDCLSVSRCRQGNRATTKKEPLWVPEQGPACISLSEKRAWAKSMVPKSLSLLPTRTLGLEHISASMRVLP